MGLVKWLKDIRKKRKEKFEDRNAKSAYILTFKDVTTGELSEVLFPYNAEYNIEFDIDKHLTGIQLVMYNQEINPDHFFMGLRQLNHSD